MSSAELRVHRAQCVCAKLREIQNLAYPIRLAPKDPDPYPDFYINRVNESEVEFRKGSNDDQITVELRKVADITVDRDSRLVYIRLLGHVFWRQEIKSWRFAPSQIGRPPLSLRA